MSIGINLLIIIIVINLFVFIFGEPSANAPALGIVKGFYGLFTGSPSWENLMSAFGNTTMWAVYLALMGVIMLASLATGSIGITTGGSGYGAVMALQTLGIALFFGLCMMPNFSSPSFGFPDTIVTILDVIFGGMIIVAVISLLKGY